LVEFLDRRAVDYAHTRVLAKWGGLYGTRDDAAIEATIQRPGNKQMYGGDVGLHELAAAYVFGLATAHGFVDGNKRTAWAACLAFLHLNGLQVVCQTEVAFRAVIELVTHVITEDAFAERLHDWIRPL
jgi:death-on-curing protein